MASQGLGFFPQRRDDGTFSVAARYRVTADAAGVAESVRAMLDHWLRKKTDVDRVDLRSEFATLPHVETVDSPDTGDIIVVFDGLATSVLWKGLMVEMVREAEAIEGLAFAGFWDLVNGRPHPASIPDR